MVVPLLLAGIGGGGAVSYLSGGSGGGARDVWGGIVGGSFAGMGRGHGEGGKGAVKAGGG